MPDGLYPQTIFISPKKETMTIPVVLEVRGKKIIKKALIDTGASSTFISKRLLRNLRLRTRALEK